MFHIGNKIYLRTKYIKLRQACKKLGPKYTGPFSIVKVINLMTVELKLPRILRKTHPVFPCNLLKPIQNSRMRPSRKAAPNPIMGREDTL